MDSIINKTAFFFVSRDVPGGAERRFFYLFQYLIEQGKSPHLIMNSELYEFLLKSSFDNKRNIFMTKLCKNRYFGALDFIVRSLLYIRQKKITHVHFCVNPSIYTLALGLIGKSLGFTCSVSIVNSMIRTNNDLSKMNRWLWRNTISVVSAVDFLSPSILRNMKFIFGDVIFAARKTAVSACSYSLRANQTREIIRKNTNKDFLVKQFDFVFASRLIPGKGVEILVEALRLCDLEGYNFRVAICGRGPLEKLILDLNLSRIDVVYFGYIDDTTDVLVSSEVALSLQQFENYPSQFLLEAIAAGCKVIATDVGDTRLLLNDDVAYLIDYDAFTLKCTMVNVDSNRSDSLTKEQDKIISHHSVDTYAVYLEKLISG